MTFSAGQTSPEPHWPTGLECIPGDTGIVSSDNEISDMLCRMENSQKSESEEMFLQPIVILI